MEQMKAAREAKIPFVLASGGNSLWSTINEGMVMDLSYYKGVFVDATSRTAIVRGGALMKDLQVALSEKGQFTGKSIENDWLLYFTELADLRS